MRGQLARCIDEMAGDNFDGAGVRQTAADDQHQSNNHGCRMSETGKRLVGRHQAGEKRDQQCDESDEIVAPASPNQENKDEKQ